MKSDMRIGLDDPARSGIFYECYRVMKEVNAPYFLVENVASMRNEDRDILSSYLGIQPIKIDAKIISAGMRNRYYWTNIPLVGEIEKKDIKLNDILESGWSDRDKARCLICSDSRPLTTPIKQFHRYFSTGFTTLIFKDEEHYRKCVEEYQRITGGKRKVKAEELDDYTGNTFDGVRYFTQNETEILQGLPHGYTRCLTRNECADVAGDGWQIDVIAYLFKGLIK